MTRRENKLQQRAVKAGIRASKKRGHIVDEKELAALRIQVMPVLPRLLMVLAGIALLGAAITGWPLSGNEAQGAFAISGIILFLFGVFGVRRTISNVLDHAVTEVAADLVGKMLGGIADRIDL